MLAVEARRGSGGSHRPLRGQLKAGDDSMAYVGWRPGIGRQSRPVNWVDAMTTGFESPSS